MTESLPKLTQQWEDRDKKIGHDSRCFITVQTLMNYGNKVRFNITADIPRDLCPAPESGFTGVGRRRILCGTVNEIPAGAFQGRLSGSPDPFSCIDVSSFELAPPELRSQQRPQP